MKNYKLLSVCAFKDSNKVLMAKVDNLEGCTVDAATSCHQSMTYPEGEEGPQVTKFMEDVFHETIGITTTEDSPLLEASTQAATTADGGLGPPL